MKKLFAAVFVLALAHGGASAQVASGDAQAGKALWDNPAMFCRFCHGVKGEGAFGPDLAGRNITLAQFKQAVRKPWGVMPAFIESQISDAEIANVAAYFVSLPANAEPGKWRFDVPVKAPRGQDVMINMGCGQCHGPAFVGPRAGLGGVNADFDEFKSLVYDHTTAMPKLMNTLGEAPPPRLRMGNYAPGRIWDTQLRDIYDWAKNEVGFRAVIAGRLGKGMAGADGVTYTLDVHNGGLAGKALTAEDMTIRLIVPAGAEVIKATGAGYQGVRVDEQTKANVAVWQLPRIAPTEKQSYTITLSRAGTAADNLRGEIRWNKPAVKTAPFDQAPIAPAPL